MGSFYSTCSISHMTLKNQKTSIQILAPNYNLSMGGDRLGLIVSNDGAQALFSPFGFPIHGEYSDCGEIDNIIRDKNVEMIEDFFNLSIDSVLSNIGDDRWYKYGEKEDKSDWKVNGKDGGPIKNQEILLKIGKTYFRTEILEYLQSGWENYIPREDKPKKYSRSEFITEMLKKLETLPPDAETPRKEQLDLIVKSIMEKLGEEIPFDELNSDAREKYYSLGIDILMGNDRKYINTYISSLVKINMFVLLPITSIEFRDDILKQYMFLCNFGGFGLNRILLPSNYGSQESNHKQLLDLNTLVNDLLIKDMVEEIEGCIEDYTENGKFDESEFIEDYGERGEEMIKILKEHKKI